VNIAELAENQTRDLGEHVRLVFEGQEFTNVEIDRTARRLANALKKLGVKRGDRVIIQMPNCPELFQCFGAIRKIGAVVVPVNYLIGEEESAYIYQDCGAETLKTGDDELAALVYTAGTTGRPKGVIHSHYGLCSRAS